MLLHRRQVLAWPSAPPVLMAEPDTAAPAKAKPTALKKGALVRVKRQAYAGSIEAGASDPNPPEYIFEGPGEILVVKGDFAQVRWRRWSWWWETRPRPRTRRRSTCLRSTSGGSARGTAGTPRSCSPRA